MMYKAKVAVDSFGGLVVSMLASETRVRGFNSADKSRCLFWDPYKTLNARFFLMLKLVGT
jgi:hypothetical protein